MQVFDNGYNRLENNNIVIGYQYSPVKILDVPEPTNGYSIETVPCMKLNKKKTRVTKNTSISQNNSVMKDNSSYNYSTVSTPQSITNVFDSKNQLTSLIKNAKQNEDSLKERNQRRGQSKLHSKKQYGW